MQIPQGNSQGLVSCINRGAFTLVEVAIAMGIFVFAATSIFGLLPVALQSSRNAIDISVATQLADSLAGKLARTQFDQLPAADGTIPLTNWFNNSGEEVPKNSDSIYEVRTLVNESASPNLRRITVTVKRDVSSRTFCYLLYNNLP